VRGRRLADAVYGAILVIAVVAALSEDPTATSWAILGGALATSLVFWIVHVYAEMLDRRTVGDTTPTWPLIQSAAWQEWPLVQAALPPLVPLLLSAAGLFGRSLAVTLSIGVGLAELAAWGYAAGQATQESKLRSTLTAGGAVALGALLAVLKNLVH
jgi:hypothetical protein